MKLLGAVLVSLTLLVPGAGGSQDTLACVFEPLRDTDQKFCRGDLEIIYPEVGDVSCCYIPKCQGYRRRLSLQWGEPRVRFPWARKDEKYVLVMVDPDSPSRAEPRFQFWRHWMVTDILGSDLRVGNIKGKVLTAYSRPKPPRYSGYHRYQFRIYEQPEHETIALSEEERVSLGTWDLKDFVEVFSLGNPVASTQFLTKNYED
ncbi:phosphatidylethanolamine-binding protein 4 [Oenanthe melanoleuca]|uniref:phosphatidylethanolamine-binding protein 4 n=1 Tax=Oenanthe melanoleuca TaxID=2939378 RepID=UPI0024C19C78|nr:phosphatidylethanolamine-binding protein 4 [Oenanthe melanoleuca]XP_056364687.1 phosphatidylethanolamine-binding protein 4 [Oenanthe melanoleuca]XP_056364688.1 phosphatidylethanolamine-binding protein 4 [Oenanthe melanoleuca]XP_056364689.1 phosphatidylethanolamine-binding protein 4 [Oenanthe melanoleuca]